MTVTILIIEHKHGMNVYPCSTLDIATAELYGYVKTYWSNEFPNEPIPTDSQRAIDQYFDEREFYTIETMELIETLPNQRESANEPNTLQQ